ncbi:HD domain-containing protein [Lachnospiraceae bacterium JLR.KK009]|jgi:HD-GYP domain-containing protein (c-di-GMP phosphodiesterase class II)|nr:hypothetical protein C810_04832 [Lachnospiraceae bacterium A2]
MREYLVSELKGNEILAKPVCLENGSIILEIGTVLKVSYKESLTALNIQKIFIEDPFERYENVNFYFKQNIFLKFENDLKEILSHHIYREKNSLRKLESLGKELVTKFEETKEKRALDVRNRSSDMYEHTIFIAILVMMLGKEYGFTRKRMEHAVLGCLLHDLGYRYINVDYQNCSYNELTFSEECELKKHTILGYAALEQEEWVPEISKLMVLSHHEKMDGSGYPLKQRTKQKECRMIQICDAFDCAISGVECQKKTIFQAFDLISNKEKYEGRMEQILEKKIGIYPAGTYVRTENGRNAVVISQTENAHAPVILYTNEMDSSNVVTENLNREKAPKITAILH